MGKRNRERVQRILAGEEEPIAAPKGVPERVLSRVTGVAQKLVEKTMSPKWAKLDLVKQVGVAKKMMRATGLVNFRSNFLKPSGFPSDLLDKQKQGMSNDQIFEFYWGCPEFIEFWKSLGMDETHLRVLLKGEGKQWDQRIG